MPRYNNSKFSRGVSFHTLELLKGPLSVILYRFRFLFLAIFIGITAAFIVILHSDFKKVKALAEFRPDVTTKIFDKNGLLVAELFKQKREVAPLDKMPENLINAFTAMEDTEFYSHMGVSPKSIVRAFFVNIMAGSVKQGGSTITQQTAKMLLTSGARNIFRKIKEACIAVMMEFTYTKDDIMHLYLNQIFLGHGAYGVESAAQLYFNKHIWECNLAESALIASLPAAPNLFSPIRRPNESMRRHRIVLSKMVEMGHITVKDAEAAYLNFWPNYLAYISELEPTVTTWSARSNNAPWFTEYIRRELVRKYGDDTVYNKGLMVYTTLDLRKQQAAEKALWSALDKQSGISSNLAFKNPDVFMDNFSEEIYLFSDLFDMNTFTKRGSRENEKINNHFRTEIVEEFEGLNFFAGLDSVGKFLDSYKSTFAEDKDMQRVEGALITINHENGYIEAMVGGTPLTSTNQLNRPLQSRRQPGSSIKPLLYAAALESREFTTATPILDSPIVYLDSESGSWTPKNYDGDFQGLVPLRRSLALSINVVSVRIAEKLGMDAVTNYYAKLLKINKNDINSRIPRNLSVALGTLDVSPFELTRAYAIIANGGMNVIPFSIRHVKDHEGNILENQEEDVKRTLLEERKNGTIQIIKPETAQLMINLLRTALEHGTGRSAYIGVPAAGKTGTTSHWRDAWFIGFLPHLTTGIWVGYDKLGLTLGHGQTGGVISAPIWGAYMKRVITFEPVRQFRSYGALVEARICEKSGLLPSRDCSAINTEAFLPNTVPDNSCSACIGARRPELPSKGLSESILREQKQNVLKSLQQNNSTLIIDDIGDELLR
ncbi:MAG: PBP1A family penicillin-binding protein [Leptospirales bacterium]|nr:PBP1A family penicillin-binding protein [Leptospirales bacterium]